MADASPRVVARSVLVAESAAMRAVVEKIDAYDDLDEPVLLTGEAGTGRGLVARLLHYGTSRRAGELVVVETSAAPIDIFASDFGDTQSVLSRARGGSLVVRDVCGLSAAAQRRLLELIAEGRHRIIASVDLELAAAVEAGAFSCELYKELAHLTITVPPLRERLEDIAPLASRLVADYSAERGDADFTLTDALCERLRAHPWPGNVAQLKCVVRRLVFGAQKTLNLSDLDALLPPAGVPLEGLAFEDLVRAKVSEFLRRVEGYEVDNLHGEVLQRVERPLFAAILEHTGGNQLRAAEILGLNRNTLRRKLSEHGLRKPAPSRSSKAVARPRPARRSKKS